jgi:rsbT co-antagonist protein RsbR
MAAAVPQSQIPALLSGDQPALIAEWLEGLPAGSADVRIGRAELEAQCRSMLNGLAAAVAGGNVTNISASGFAPVRDALAEISRDRALGGFTPSETATFIFALKRPLFTRLRALLRDADTLANEVWTLTELLDALGLYTTDVFQKSREEVIIRQQQEIAELSTPVVRLWRGVLALPLIGTLDSSRTQVVMENLLQAIVTEEADIAIIDITGVPTVDTLVAQHLLKTIAAARLMGAECVISGIRPQIAQTMVHLGVDLNVVSKATLADAFALALRRLNRAVVPVARIANSGAA